MFNDYILLFGLIIDKDNIASLVNKYDMFSQIMLQFQ